MLGAHNHRASGVEALFFQSNTGDPYQATA